MSKVERKELVTQMRIVSILFTGTNGPKFMTIFLIQDFIIITELHSNNCTRLFKDLMKN
jgi:hypothetical protein